METVPWTDERMTEHFDGIDRRFDDVDRRFDEMKESIEWRHKDTKESIDHLSTRVEAQTRELRHEFHTRMAVIEAGLTRLWISILAGLFAVVAAIIAKGG
jgi:hypothetical protein